MECKFKVGDVIEPIEKGRGFEQAKVVDIFTCDTGRFRGRKMYLLKIPCGQASVPIESEVYYKICERVTMF